MAEFDENINIDVYRFREIARSLFDGLNLSDGEILDKIAEYRKDLYGYSLFLNELEVLLDLKAGFGTTESKLELIINRVKEMSETIPKNESEFFVPKDETSFFKLKDDVQQAFLFRDRVKASLFEGVSKDKYESTETLPDEYAISFVEYLVNRQKYWKRDDEVNQFVIEVKQHPEQFTGDKDREIERLNRNISSIASFLGLPEDTEQPDICFAIMKLKENQGDGKKALIERLHELLDQERSDSRNLCNQIADLRHDLVIAQKVIARLVGE